MSQQKLNIKAEKVDTSDFESYQELEKVHVDTFGRVTHIPDFRIGWWWVLRHEDEPIGFIGGVPSSEGKKIIYLSRVGVRDAYRGLNLQCRLMRLFERFAKRQGFHFIVSDCTDNPASANSFIKCNYRTYLPKTPWSFASAIYWRKPLKKNAVFE